MPDTVAAYIEASDNANDYNDALIEGLEQTALEDIDNLFNSTVERDDELWTLQDVNPTLVIADYDEVERDERDLEWSLGLAGLSMAALTQFYIDNRETTLIKPLAYREQLLDGFDLTRAQMVAAGKRGVEIEGVAKFYKLQAKYLDELSFLKDMNSVDLYETLLERGALRSADKYLIDQTAYVRRMTGYQPGSPEFKSAVNDLISADSRANLKAMNRRSVERIYSEREANGNENALMVWVGEGGPRTCGACSSRFGEVKRYKDWEADGMPGASVCDGGDRCRCHLAAV
jgi:hypothetical protein